MGKGLIRNNINVEMPEIGPRNAFFYELPETTFFEASALYNKPA